MSFLPEKMTHFSTLLLSDLILFSSMILSHPLYFSYFIFFSPYLLKLLSFLSPLFISTSLLLLVFFTVSPPHLESKASFLLSFYNAVLNTLRSRLDEESCEEFHVLQDLEACIEVLEKSIFEVDGNVAAEFWQSKSQADIPVDIHVVDSPTYQALPDPPKEVASYVVEEENKKFTTESPIELSHSQVKCVLPDSIQGKKNASPVPLPVAINAGESFIKEAKEDKVKPLDDDDEWYAMESPPKVLGSCGSMRKDKEWKRTLACKLYEERQNVDGVDGGEGMDLLWEAYDSDTAKKANKPNNTTTTNNKEKAKTKKEKKREIEYLEDDDEEEEDDDDDEVMNSQLCCLQALKFSTRKMNLGMGKPNLMKISKALKGMRWFHHASKHGRKSSN